MVFCENSSAVYYLESPSGPPPRRPKPDCWEKLSARRHRATKKTSWLSFQRGPTTASKSCRCDAFQAVTSAGWTRVAGGHTPIPNPSGPSPGLTLAAESWGWRILHQLGEQDGGPRQVGSAWFKKFGFASRLLCVCHLQDWGRARKLHLDTSGGARSKGIWGHSDRKTVPV